MVDISGDYPDSVLHASKAEFRNTIRAIRTYIYHITRDVCSCGRRPVCAAVRGPA